ncbi:hypothetical protein MKEN_01160700 [Mycena kentingensis (nom. inval.)]|nr:hypothetical protein MKEN_01160700 [Mycena kentingensis (nom. inval.)]
MQLPKLLSRRPASNSEPPLTSSPADSRSRSPPASSELADVRNESEKPSRAITAPAEPEEEDWCAVSGSERVSTPTTPPPSSSEPSTASPTHDFVEVAEAEEWEDICSDKTTERDRDEPMDDAVLTLVAQEPDSRIHLAPSKSSPSTITTLSQAGRPASDLRQHLHLADDARIAQIAQDRRHEADFISDWRDLPHGLLRQSAAELSVTTARLRRQNGELKAALKEQNERERDSACVTDSIPPRKLESGTRELDDAWVHCCAENITGSVESSAASPLSPSPVEHDCKFRRDLRDAMAALRNGRRTTYMAYAALEQNNHQSLALFQENARLKSELATAQSKNTELVAAMGNAWTPHDIFLLSQNARLRRERNAYQNRIMLLPQLQDDRHQLLVTLDGIIRALFDLGRPEAAKMLKDVVLRALDGEAGKERDPQADALALRSIFGAASREGEQFKASG